MIIFDYLRKEKAEELSTVYHDGMAIHHNIEVGKYDQAVILPAKQLGPGHGFSLGCVVDQMGNIIDLSVSEPRCKKYEAEIWEESDKTAVYCGYFRGGHWGHFLVDVAPRLWYALEKDENVDEYVFVDYEGIDDLFLQGNIVEFLELLGIADKIVILTEPVKYRRVIVPQMSYNYHVSVNLPYASAYYSEKYRHTFDRVVERALASNKENKSISSRIFLTRSGLGASEKTDCGIEMLDSFFQNNGYRILYPERISLRKLIYMMNHCTDFACIQGSAQHNLLFVKKAVNCLIIERGAYVNQIQNHIIMMQKLNAVFIDANLYILPANTGTGPFIYTYNTHLKAYARKMEMNPPDSQYRTKWYRKRTIIQYLKYFKLPPEHWCPLFTNSMWIASNESIQELQTDFSFVPFANLKEFTDLSEIRIRARKYLLEYNLVYQGWRGLDLYQAFVKTAEDGLNGGKTEFLIYPFGKNGMLLKQILNERYGIKERVILDNELWKSNKSIKPVNEIKNFYNDKSCLILTSDRVDCRNLLLKFCEMSFIKGPFLP